MSYKIHILKLSVLDPSPTNPRKKFDQQKLDELGSSIREHGVMSPLLVRPRDGRYEIVAGERRYRAAGGAGLDEVPCIIRELSDSAVLENQLIENLQRDDLDPLEEAQGFRLMLDLKDQGGNNLYTAETIAAKIGKTVQRVYSRLKLLNLPEAAVKALGEGIIPIWTAELIARIPDKKLREKAAKEVIEPKHYDRPLTSRETQALIQRSYMRTLEGCDFDPEDESLHPNKVKCSVCPHRAANCPDAEGVRGDTCLNPGCFEKKSRLAFERWKLKHESEGKKVLSQGDNKKYMDGNRIVSWSCNLVPLDEPPEEHLLIASARSKKNSTWRTLIEGRGVEIKIARCDNGTALECVERVKAIEAAKLNGHNIFRLTNQEERVSFEEQQKREREERKRRTALAIKLLSEVSQRCGQDVEKWLRELVLILIARGESGLILAARQISAKKLATELLSAKKNMLCEIAAQFAFAEYVGYDGNIEKHGLRILKDIGIDPKKTDKEQKAAATKPKAKPKSKPSPPKAKRVSQRKASKVKKH